MRVNFTVGRTQVLLYPASVAWCQDEALAKSKTQDTRGCTTLKKTPYILKGGETYWWSSFLVLCFHKESVKNMSAKETINFSLEILWTHSPRKYSHPVMKKSKHAILIKMSLLVLHLAQIFVYSSRSVVFLGYNNAYEHLSSYLNKT